VLQAIFRFSGFKAGFEGSPGVNRYFKGCLRVAAASLFLGMILSCAEEQPPPPPPGAIPAGEVIGSAEVTGRVVFSGEAPPPESINMSSDSICSVRGKGQTREDLIVSTDGELKNVFVHITDGLGERIFAPPESMVELNQDGCTYRPHVIGVQVNQYVELINSDPTLHNVNAQPESSKGFNVGMPVQRMRIKKFFESPEVMVPLRCDLHNWMSAYVGVVAHPFFDVTEENGMFSLAGLPAGIYTVRAWHETLGSMEQQVDVADGETREIAFEFKP
jgi:hypothetical protein